MPATRSSRVTWTWYNPLMSVLYGASYSVEPGDLDVPLGCVVRATSEAVRDRDSLVVARLRQLNGAFTLQPNEELVSHIIELSAAQHSDTKVMPYLQKRSCFDTRTNEFIQDSLYFESVMSYWTTSQMSRTSDYRSRYIETARNII